MYTLFDKIVIACENLINVIDIFDGKLTEPIIRNVPENLRFLSKLTNLRYLDLLSTDMPRIEVLYPLNNLETLILPAAFRELDKLVNIPSLKKIAASYSLTCQEDVFSKIRDCIGLLEDSPNDLQWLLDTTEKWCKDRAIYLALVESIAIADGNNENKNQDAIPSILSDALAVSFDNQVGHDYLEDYEERYELD